MNIRNKGRTNSVLGLALLGATVLSTPAFALDQSVVAPKAMIVAGHPLAVESGLKALRAGGSACDAFVATAATLSLTLTDMMGPLGSGFALIHKPGDDQLVRAIDYNGVAPLATDISKFATMEDKRRGILAPTVPGNLKGWEAIHQDCGRLPWADLWADAIDYADNGWPIDTATAFHIGRHIPELAPYESWGEEFLADGEPPKAGSMQRRPELAESYRQFAELGSAALYNGPIGEQLVAFMEKEGGLITQADLDAYEVIWSDPIETTYDNFTIYGSQPGSSSITWMEILKIVEGYDLKALGHNTPEYLRLLIEATKHAYQHGYQYVGDLKFHDVPVEKLLSAESAAEIRAQIDATPIREFAPYDVASLYQPPYDNHATSHMVIVDEDGNMISSTNTLGTFYGMGMVVEGTGLLMSNGMDWFDIGPNIWTGEEKSVLTMEAGKRNRWTLAPGMIFDGEQPYMLVGGAGAEATMWGIAQPILNAIEFGMDPQKALDTPRFRYGDIYHYTGGVNIGLDNSMPAAAREGLAAMGYPVDEPGTFSNSSRGTTQMLVIDPTSGALWGGAAPDGRDFVSGY